jgi:predicted HTH transcriptional regulator
MALTNIPLADIAEGHLQRLIAAQAAESLHVEYKRETYGTNDDQRREFLADVSSFANAAGGDLVIGMTAANGIPTGPLHGRRGRGTPAPRADGARRA